MRTHGLAKRFQTQLGKGAHLTVSQEHASVVPLKERPLWAFFQFRVTA